MPIDRSAGLEASLPCCSGGFSRHLWRKSSSQTTRLGMRATRRTPEGGVLSALASGLQLLPTSQRRIALFMTGTKVSSFEDALGKLVLGASSEVTRRDKPCGSGGRRAYSGERMPTSSRGL